MRRVMTLSAFALALTAICLAAADEPAPAKEIKETGAQTATKAAARAPAKPSASPAATAIQKAASQTASQPATAAASDEESVDHVSADEEAICETADTFVKAYGRGDAKAVAAHFTSDAEYVDEQGTFFRGRQAIEASLAASFEEGPGSRLEIAIDTIRFVSPGVAIEDGTTTVTSADGSSSNHSGYTAVHVKTNGKWLTASTREHALKRDSRQAAQLKQLDWLLGNWVDEADDSIVEFSCQAIDNGNFLVREFIVKIAGQKAVSGSQRIGWDPVNGKLRAWTFDSDGGYGEGTWHRNDDSWVFKSTGVTSDGQSSSSTNLFTVVSDDVITWQAVDREIEGASLPDTDEYILVRAPPSPTEVEKTVTKN